MAIMATMLKIALPLPPPCGMAQNASESPGATTYCSIWPRRNSHPFTEATISYPAIPSPQISRTYSGTVLSAGRRWTSRVSKGFRTFRM